jgi:hypothetical protein
MITLSDHFTLAIIVKKKLKAWKIQYACSLILFGLYSSIYIIKHFCGLFWNSYKIISQWQLHKCHLNHSSNNLIYIFRYNYNYCLDMMWTSKVVNQNVWYRKYNDGTGLKIGFPTHFRLSGVVVRATTYCFPLYMSPSWANFR